MSETVNPQYEQMVRQLAEMNGSLPQLRDSIERTYQLIESSLAPRKTVDPFTINTTYGYFDSYGYPYNYIFVGDNNAGVTLTIGDKFITHDITLVGGWNVINSVDGWWKASQPINVTLLRSKDLPAIQVNGNVQTQLTGRNTNYQRVLVNSTISANSSVGILINGGLGLKVISATFVCTANAHLSVYACDANGNNVQSSDAASSTGLTQNLTISEFGGSPYVYLVVYDNSGATNTCQYVDVWTTNG